MLASSAARRRMPWRRVPRPKTSLHHRIRIATPRWSVADGHLIGMTALPLSVSNSNFASSPSIAAGDQPLRRSLRGRLRVASSRSRLLSLPRATWSRSPNAVAASSRKVGAIGASKEGAGEGPPKVDHYLRSVMRSRVRPEFSRLRHSEDLLPSRRSSAFLCRRTLGSTKLRAAGCARAGARCGHVLQRH